jgi:hypothetical protein
MSDYRIEGRPQTIFRTVKDPDNPYVQIDRRPLDNDQLSFKAKGILTYLMSRPDGWEVSIADLVKRSADKETSVRSGIQELREAGHLRYVETRDDEGRFAGTLIEVYEVPNLDNVAASSPYSENPHAGFPHADNPHAGNQGQVLSIELETKENKKEAVSGSAEAEPPKADGFDIMKEYTDFTGNLVSSLYLAQELELIESEYPEDWIVKAFRLSAEKKSLSYAKSILKRWKAEGGPTNDVKRKPDQTAPQEPRKYDIPEGYEGERADRRTPADTAWRDVLEQIRRMFDRQIADAVDGKLTAERLEGKTLTVSGDLAYYRYMAKTLNRAAGAAGFTLEWGE